MPHLPPEWLPHFSAGVSIRLGTCSRSGRPGICRALGAEVLPDGRVTVLVAENACGQALEAIRETRHVALVLGLPTTHRTLHIKGHDAETIETQPRHHALLAAHFEAFTAQISVFGFPRERLVGTWYTEHDGELVAVRFSIAGAWDQTPGPGAGQPVALMPAGAGAHP